MKFRQISIYAILILTVQATQAQMHSPLTEALELVWIDSTSSYDPYDEQRPLIQQDVVFPYNNTEYALDMRTGKKLFYENSRQYFANLFEDSLLLFDTRKEAVVLNIYSGDVILAVGKKYGAYNGYLLPKFVKNSIYIKTGKKELSAYDTKSGQAKWKFSTTHSIFNQPTVFNNEVIFCDKTAIYGLDEDTGKLLWKEEVGERVTSGITIDENIFYLWVLPEGLLAFDPSRRAVVWKYNEFDDQYGNYTLPILGDTLFFANKHIYAINKVTGTTIWKSDEDCAVGSGYIASASDLLIYYEGCSAEDVEFISAVKKDNGKKVYQGLTSETFPPDNAEDPLNLSDIDYKKLKFVKTSVRSMSFAVADGIMYAFKVVE